MALILTKKLFYLAVFTLPILLGLSLGLIILLGLPMKLMTAIILAMGFITILLIIHNVERILLFTTALIIPFHIGSGLPPIISYLDHTGVNRTFDIQLIDVLIILLFVCLLTRLGKHQTEIRLYPFITIPALFWLVANILSTVNAWEVGLTLMQVGQMAKLFLLYIVIANSIKNELDVKCIILALILGTLFEGLLGVAQWLLGKPLGLSFLGEASQLFYGRSLGTIGHPNGYGAYLSATIPLGVCLMMLDVRGINKALSGFMLGAGILGLVFSQSRGGWLGFVVASIAVLSICISNFKKGQNLRFVYLGVILSLIVVFTLVASPLELIVNRLTSKQGKESALSRITMAQGAMAMIQDYPILGVGANNYTFQMPRYDPYDYVKQGRAMVVHDIYLLIAAETGLVGFGMFSWFLASLFIRAWQIIKRSQNHIAVAAISAFAGLLALSLHGIADYDVLANITVFRLIWLFAAFLAVLKIEPGYKQTGREQTIYPKICLASS